MNDDILAALNPTQKEAVKQTQGPVLILAGPGSGKTRVITHRIAYLVKDCGADPHRIIAVTFTNKAAREMKERLEQLLRQEAEALTLGTFHAICSRTLRREGRAIGLNPSFVIYDDEDQLKLIKQCLQELALDPKQYAPRAVQSGISAAKSRLIDPQGYALQVNSYFEEIILRVYQRYQTLLTQSAAVDFDDLLMKTVQLFRDHSEILDRYQSLYLYILVDEFQDTNTAQYELLKLIGGKYRNLCVFGDPDQSIYSWRFADLRNILSFEKDYPEARVVLLEQNYRSTQTILEAASDVISAGTQHKPKKLWTENEPGCPVTLIEGYSEQEEAQAVVCEVENLISQNHLSPKDCAVMYRVNAQSRALEEAFMRYGMPYKLVRGTRFYRRREVKDVIAYLRVIHNPSDNTSLAQIINVPSRGIGQSTLNKLQGMVTSDDPSLYKALQRAAMDNSLSSRVNQSLSKFVILLNELVTKSHELTLPELLDKVLQQTRYREYLLEKEEGEDRWENVMELKGAAGEYDELDSGEGLTNFLEKVSLVSDIDGLDVQSNAVTFITLHQAKGLEFPVVFIVGMEEGLLPHRKSFDAPEEMEEERRLCYVGITRAQKRLYLSRSYRRSLFGSSVNPPSRFLHDISPQLIASTKLEEEKTKLRASATAAPPPHAGQSTKLQVGDWVHHKKFGDGIVLSCCLNRGDHDVTIAFKEAGVKKLLLSLAHLEKIEERGDFSSQTIDTLHEPV